jgi:transcriptional regulator with PAS, ATPase and Fis domain
MRAIRSLLWIGPGQGLSECGVSEAPTLDVTWVKSVAEVFALPPMPMDGAVLEGTCVDGLLGDLRRLQRYKQCPPVMVCLQAEPPSEACAPLLAERIRKLVAEGASEVIVPSRDPSSPSLLEELLERVDRLVRERRREDTPAALELVQEASDDDGPRTQVIGQSQAIRDVFALVERAQGSTATVLLCGETGTGKEVVARRIHEGSPRKRGPMVAVNCAAFPETLLESELFGYRKGAFTGADNDRAGLLQLAHRSTLFLDEISETSPALQAKLLRALQEREVKPLGASRPIPVDVRVIAASNRPLLAEVEAGRFREDLYYRLAVFPITIPALRQRPDDVLPLARHFLALHGETEHKPGCRLSAASQRLLQTHRWPGNVRELENEMQRALALANADQLITPAMLSKRVLGIVEVLEHAPVGAETLREELDRIEAWLIRRALEHHGGRKAATARKLGVTREGLYKKLKRLKIE